MIMNHLGFDLNLLGSINEAFETEQRRIIGVGVRVEGNTINKIDIEIVKKFVGSKGIVLILNTKTKVMYLLEL